MKYSKLLDTKVITERQGAQVPRLVQYANDEEINSKRDFLDWDILDATSVRLLADTIEETNNNQAEDINTLNSQLVQTSNNLNSQIGQINNTLRDIAASGGASIANTVVYDNTTSGLIALNVQAAIDELNVNIGSRFNTLNTGLTTEVTRAEAVEKSLTDSINNIAASGGASMASAVLYNDDNTQFGSRNAQGVIEIIDSKIKILQALIDNIKDAGYKIQLLEQTQYDVLTSYDQDTLYFIYKPIEYTLVDKPINRIFVYDGTVHTLASTAAYTVTGTGGSQIGTYQFNVSLNIDPVANTGYKWSDNTTNNIVVTYTIKDASTLGWSFGSSFPIKFS